jgi:hypothetical protein
VKKENEAHGGDNLVAAFPKYLSSFKKVSPSLFLHMLKGNEWEERQHNLRKSCDEFA